MPGGRYSRDELIGIFEDALSRGELDLAKNAATNMQPPLELDRALRLTIALGELEEPGYERAALRWIARFCEEEQPPMEAVKKAADALAELQAIATGSDAGRGLHDLAAQIKKRHAR